MEITIERIARKEGYTIGRLSVDGKYFCDTLEPQWRNVGPGKPGVKVAGRTAIPEGRYPLVITKSARFHRWLPLLVGVPGFSGIRIHAGNTAEDTAGCILVGRNTVRGGLTGSRVTLERLQRDIMLVKEMGKGVWVNIF